MAALFKFRCYQCEKLLGAPASKMGAVVQCPRCGAELIIPAPDGQEATPEPDEGDAPRLEDLGLRLDLALRPEPAQAPRPEPVGPDPIAFLEQAGDEPEAGPGPGEPEPEAEVAGMPRPPDPLDAPLVPGSRRRGRSALMAEPGARRRDVVLPRTGVVAWALFALLAQAFAFAAGMMIGHFLWR